MTSSDAGAAGQPVQRLDPPQAGTALLVTACGAQVLEVLSVTVVVIALPRIGGDLALSGGELSLVVSLYAVLYGALLLVAGRVVDVAGARAFLVVGLAVTCVGALVCALAGTGGWLLAGRGLQGIGGALVTPSALALLVVSFPDGTGRRRAMRWWTAAAAGGGGLGFGLGGVLVAAGGWRSVFAAVAVVAAVVLVAMRWTVPAPSPAPSATPLQAAGRQGGRRCGVPVDVVEVVCLVGGLVLLVVGAGSVADAAADPGTRTGGWPQVVALPAGLVGFAAVLLVVFLLRQRSPAAGKSSAGPGPVPLVGVEALRNAGFVRAVVVSLVNTATVSAAGTVLALVAAERLLLGPVATGLVLLPFSVAVVVGAWCGGVWLRRPRQVGMAAGLGVSGLALVVMAVGSWTTSTLVVVCGVALGGLGLSWAALASTDAATGALGPQRAGVSAGAVNSAAQVGTALGVAVLVAVAQQAGGRGGVDGYAVALLLAGGLAGLVALAVVRSGRRLR